LLKALLRSALDLNP